MDKTTKYIVQFVCDDAGAKKSVAASKLIQSAYNDMGKTFSGIKRMVDTSTTAFGKKGDSMFSASFIDNGGKFNKVVGQLDKNFNLISGTTKITTQQFGQLGNSAMGLGDNFIKLLSRAALTIPVWFALRAALAAVFGTIKEGAQYIIDFDSAMAKSRAVVQGIADIPGFMKRLGDEVKTLSGETGKSVKEVSEIFYRFAETGLNAEDSLIGMRTALKLSVATFQDTEPVARMIVDLFNMFGDSMGKTMSTQDKMNTIASTFAILWKENAGNLGEYIDTMKQFAPVAQQWGLSVKQTLALGVVLNNFMQRGSTAGTQLSRAFMELTKNLSTVELILGRQLRGTNFSYFDIFIELLQKLKEQSGQSTNEVQKNLMQLFGMRSMKGVGSLISGLDKVIKTMKEMEDGSISLEEGIKRLDALYNIQNDTLKLQLDRMGELKKQLVASFMGGTDSANDLLKVLKFINTTLEGMIELVKQMPSFFPAGLPLAMGAGMAKSLAKNSGADSWFNAIASGPGGFTASFLKNMSKKKATESPKSGTSSALAKMGKDIAESPMDVYNRIAEVVYGKNGSLPSLELQLQQTKNLEQFGATQLEIERKRLGVLLERSDAVEKEKEIQEQILKVQEAIDERITKYSNTLRTSFTSAFADLIKGQSSLNSFMDTISKTISDSIAQSVSSAFVNKFFNLTGIGNAFGKLGGGLEDMFSGGLTGGANLAAPIMSNSIVQGAQAAAPILAAAVGNSSFKATASAPNASSGGSNSFLSKVLSYGGTAFSAYSAYQAGKQGGASGIFGGAASGAMAGSTFGGWGTIIGGVVGGLWGLFQKKKKPVVDIQEEQKTIQIASRIDVTNKKLDVVNRNLIAIKQEFAYMLPESAYFGTSRNLNDQFSISARRGIS